MYEVRSSQLLDQALVMTPKQGKAATCPQERFRQTAKILQCGGKAHIQMQREDEGNRNCR